MKRTSLLYIFLQRKEKSTKCGKETFSDVYSLEVMNAGKTLDETRL